MSIAKCWDQIIRWHETNTPPGTFTLNDGASGDTIAAFERRLDLRLPPDLKESLQLHDGGDCWLFWFGDFMSLDAIERQWLMYSEWQANAISGPIKPILWNKKRIYLTDNSGDHLTLDLDPAESGNYGQLIDHCHEVGPETVVAASWLDFLRLMIDGLQNGTISYSPDDETVMKRE